MKYLKAAVVLSSAMIGAMSSAIAGVADVVTTTVEALSGTVTYSTEGTKPLNTKVGYTVTIARTSTSTNTVNNVVFYGETSVATATGTNPAEFADFLEANGDGGVCRQGDTRTKVVCNFGQMRAGDSKTFAVFFKGPVESTGNCFSPGGTPCEAVRFTGATNYSEGSGDGTGSFPNDQSAWTVADVPLGTANPTNVKSAVSKTSDNIIFTGTDGAPSPASPTTFPFATEIRVPNPPTNGSATIILTPLVSNDQVTLCTQAGNFSNCYEANVDVPSAVYIPGTQYLTIILRIDASEVINPFRKERIQVYYGANDINPVPPCQNGLPPLGEQRCVFSVDRYPNQGTLGALRRDVEVVVRAYSNGLLRTR
jgi:hypothetical protein